MSAILIIPERMLYVLGYRVVDVFISALLGCERRIVVVDTADAHRAAVANIVVNALNTEDVFKLAVWDEGGVQYNTAVIKLLMLGEDKAQRVRSRKDKLHAAARIDIRELPSRSLRLQKYTDIRSLQASANQRLRPTKYRMI